MKIKYICNRCGNGIYKSRGWNKTKTKREFRCSNCGKNITLSFRQVEDLKHNKIKQNNPKILLLDIETAPMTVLVWGLWKQRIYPENVIKEWSCLSWSAKWLCDNEVMSAVVSPKEAIDRVDKSIIKGIWELINEADILIAHNLLSFDNRKLMARFIINGLPPPMPYQTIDTLKHSQKNFAFSSHKLDYLNRMFNLQLKTETSYNLWKRCINGDIAALKEMESYNRSDVTALEELYLRIRPWIKSHPNIGLYFDNVKTVCPNCGSDILEWKGQYYTQAGKFKSFRCECGAIGRSRYANLTKEERRNLIRPVAR